MRQRASRVKAVAIRACEWVVAISPCYSVPSITTTEVLIVIRPNRPSMREAAISHAPVIPVAISNRSYWIIRIVTVIPELKRCY
jgi:hypothetical protein